MNINIKYLLASFTTLTLVTSSGAQPLQNPPCNICGSPTEQQTSFEITNPDAVLHIDMMMEEGKTCAEWASDGHDGRIPQQVCDMLPAVVVYVCDCQEKVVEMESSYPSPLPSTCQFCSDGITLTLQYDANVDDDDDDDYDGFDETLCQRLVAGAQLISADSLYCEKLQVGEQLCCPSNNSGGGVISMDMSLDLSYLYHVGRSKASKAKTRKANHHDLKSKGGKFDGAR